MAEEQRAMRGSPGPRHLLGRAGCEPREPALALKQLGNYWSEGLPFPKMHVALERQSRCAVNISGNLETYKEELDVTPNLSPRNTHHC